MAIQPQRLVKQVTLVAKTASLDKKRLLQWILAYAGFSAAWSIEESKSSDLALAVAKIAAAELQH